MKLTFTSFAVAPASDTGTSACGFSYWPSVTITSPIESEGSLSSSAIVTTPIPSVTIACSALLRSTSNVSSGSSISSPTTSMKILFAVSPARIVSSSLREA